MFQSRTFSTLANRIIHQKEILSYEDCIETLNSLQSNANFMKQNAIPHSSSTARLAEVQTQLDRAGVTQERLNSLSVIHVAGTKGKGTTCAFTEKILRDHGYKTGFFSSPHLIEVRERIRINGKPINQQLFTTHFSNIFQKLNTQKTHNEDMPLYFRFLLIMALDIFLDQQVDVAILEVGIGGEYDCTNVLRNVAVVGITSLGLDHTAILGNTIESIAWNKAGIMKEGAKAFTVCQPDGALKVLKERSIERNCPLEVVTSGWKTLNHAYYPADIFNLNAILAIALSENWLILKHNNNNNALLSRELAEKALKTCDWPGRFQVKRMRNLLYHLDGAHTLESINICTEWFKNVTKSNRRKALVFNVTGGRNHETFFKKLQECNFCTVLFASNKVALLKIDNLDAEDEFLQKYEQHKTDWLKLEEGNVQSSESVHIFPTVNQALDFLDQKEEEMDVLVTGSLHLVGAVLSVLGPDMNT